MSTRIASLYAEIGADTSKLKAGLNESKSSLENTRAGLDTLKNTVAGVTAGMAAFAGTFKMAMEIGKQGAQLELTEMRFNKLAASINTTADSLNTKLKAATGGMLSNAAVMEQATQIISLGLAKDEQGVVSLAELVTKLGWDMQTVIMTFANDSKMRLDALGLSVEDVDKRMERLKATGVSADKAFDMAVIEAGQAKLKLMGDAANTSAGSFARLDAATQNLSDSISKKLAPRLANAAEAANLLLTWSEKLSEAQNKHSQEVIKTSASYEDYITEMQRSYGAMGKQLDSEGKLIETHMDAQRRAVQYTGAQAALTRAQYDAAAAANKYGQAIEANRPRLDDLRYAEQDLSSIMKSATETANARAAQMGSITSLAIEYTDAEKKRGEVEAKLAKLEGDIVSQGPVRVVQDKKKTVGALDQAAASAKLAAEQARLAAVNEDLATAQRKKGETDTEFNARVLESRARAADLTAGIAELSGKSKEYTVTVGGATEQQLKERDALRETLAEMQRTAEIEAAKSAFQALGKALEAGRLGESEYLKVAKQLNDQTQLYSDKALQAATNAVLLNQALGNTESADAAWAAIMKYGNALGSAVNLQQQLTAGLGAPSTPAANRRAGGEAGEGYATGGSFVVPAGYPNDSYPMRVSSGERVRVTPSNVTNNRYGDHVIINDTRAMAMFIDAQRRERQGRAAGDM